MPSSSKIRIVLRGDGTNGDDGFDGKDGLDGGLQENDNGCLHGQDGTDAQEPQAGQDGQDITLTLATQEPERMSEGSARHHKKLVQCHASSDQGVLLDDAYPLNSLPHTIAWSSIGGQGGNGAMGGCGGRGAPGVPGVDALPPDIPGSDGGAGGNGGKGGAGSSGGVGGRGGSLTVKVSSKDAYLLMMVEPCTFQHNLLKGGPGGAVGEHGPGGVGGKGGKGGMPLTLLPNPEEGAVSGGKSSKSKVRVHKVVIAAGQDGGEGADGLTPTWDIATGDMGDTGTFEIQETDSDGFVTTYPGRYNLAFENLELEGNSPMADPSECEFGDVISIRNIKVKNTGQMPLPRFQEVHFCIKDAADPNVTPLISRKDAFLSTSGDTVEPGDFCISEGELNFFAGFPGEVADEYDFEPLQQTTHFHIQAFQYGPIKLSGKERTSDFKREYTNFHENDGKTVNLQFGGDKLTARDEGVTVNLRYPIENTDGLKALRSLCPGEETIVSFGLDNVGAVTLGGFDVENAKSSPRRVAVRYFYLRSTRLFDMPSDQVHCSTHRSGASSPASGGEIENTSTVIDLLDNTRLIDVPEIAPGESHNFKTKLALGNDVPVYTRMALIVDVFIATLPLPRGMKMDQDSYSSDKRMPPMSVVQRRKLEFICEPRFNVDQEDVQVVLVTSYATTRVQYDAWTTAVLTETLSLKYQIYSVSRYGTLDPNFELENGTTLKEAFRNKIIILLTEPFRENARDKETISPLDLLPNGTMQQASGYDASTRWLIVGAGQSKNKRLLQQHLMVDTDDDVIEYSDVASYQKHVQKLVDARAMVGREKEDLPIRKDVINVSLLTSGSSSSKEHKADQKLRKAAESLAEWLKQTDPLNQYTIEYYHALSSSPNKKSMLIKRKKACLIVRRGYCRSMNSVVCVAGKYTAEPKQIKSNGIIMSIAEVMSQEKRVAYLAEAIRNQMPEMVITAFKYACVSDMIRESNNFLVAEMKMNDDLELCFPSIGSLLDSVEMLALLRDCKSWQDLKKRTSDELSDLLARLELVANSKDLRPRIALMNHGQKKTTLEAMSDIVARLRVQWKPVISNARVEDVKKALKEEIKEFLKEDTGKKVLNVRVDRRWIQGLNYVHSTENDSAFGIANTSRRLIELDIDTQTENYKIPAPSVRVYSSKEMKELMEMLAFRRERCRLVAQSFRLKRQFSLVEPACQEEI